MVNAITTVGGALPAILKNTQVTLSLAGWPAAAAVIAVCGAGTAVYAIKASSSTHVRKGVAA